MAKTIGLAQLAQKKYTIVEGMPEKFTASIGIIEDTWDGIIYGPSNAGKTSFIAQLIGALVKALNCRVHYVAYEEGHGMTIQITMIKRYNLLQELGTHAMQITDHFTYDELFKAMGKRNAAKIWIIDSIQASKITADQWAALKRKYVNGKKRKILIGVSWAKGKYPLGADAAAIEYYANIKMYVHSLIMEPHSRFGGGEKFVIHEETAIKRLGEKAFYKLIGKHIPKKAKPVKQVKEEPAVCANTE